MSLTLHQHFGDPLHKLTGTTARQVMGNQGEAPTCTVLLIRLELPKGPSKDGCPGTRCISRRTWSYGTSSVVLYSARKLHTTRAQRQALAHFSPASPNMPVEASSSLHE